jgi:hypothetical protein
MLRAGWRCGGIKVLPLSVVFPLRCISSVSPRFYFKRHTFCFLPLAAILESQGCTFCPGWPSYVSCHTWMTHAVMPSIFLLLWGLRNRFSRWDWNCDLPNLSFPHRWDDRHVLLYPLVEMEVLQTFCSWWSWTMVLQIWASEVARISGISHQCWASYSFHIVFFYWVACI